jgi:hypothetical protein
MFCSYPHRSNISTIKTALSARVGCHFLCWHFLCTEVCPSRVTCINIPSPMRTAAAWGRKLHKPKSRGGFSPAWITQQMNMRVDYRSKVCELCEIWCSHSGVSEHSRLLGCRRLVNSNGRFERSWCQSTRRKILILLCEVRLLCPE